MDMQKEIVPFLKLKHKEWPQTIDKFEQYLNAVLQFVKRYLYLYIRTKNVFAYIRTGKEESHVKRELHSCLSEFYI